jgi:YVTN family beta-propeller protein
MPTSFATLTWSLIAAASTALTAISPAGAEPPRYRVTRQIALGAPDRWDYVVYDAPSHRVYVAHGDRLTVVDSQRGQVLGQVAGFPGGTHGTAIVASAGYGYTDDGRAGEVGAFDLRTLKVQRRIKAEPGADSMAFDSSSGHVFVIDGDSGDVTVIDPRTNTAVATVRVGGGLETGAAGGDGKLYVNGAERSELVRIDTATDRVDARWPIPQCTSPHGLALDVAAHRAFVSCVNNVLTVVDTHDGHTVATLPIGSGSDAAAFDPVRKRLFSSNGRDGTITVILERGPDSFVALGDIPTAVSARTMAVDPQSGRLFLAAAAVDKSVAQTPAPPVARSRHTPIVRGSLKLLFLDPAP